MPKKESNGAIVENDVEIDGEDMTLLECLLDDENDENIVLFADDGSEVEMEQIAVIPHDEKLYAILRPLDADEDAAAVFLIDSDDEESVISIEDEKLASQILDIYNSEIVESGAD